MQKRTVFLFTILGIILIFGLTGCAHNFDAPISGFSNASSYNHSSGRSYANNLPADYPTRAQPDGDLWEDVRDNLQLYNYANVKQVKTQIYWFQTHQSYLTRTLVRGAQYMYFINQLSKKYHLPSEIILIPIFESGYNPVNRNSSSGASGLWQFMPATARGYGIRMNSSYEGRYDPIQSSYAAMKDFSYLHDFFNNDWTLTFAAYDAGEGTIQNAMFRNQRNGLPTNYWSLRFPRYETYEYVPKLLALSAIVKDPGRYGITLPAINNAPYFEQVSVGKSMSFAQIARLANSSVTELHNLNPAYIRYRIPASGPYVISIPVSKVAIFKRNLAGKSESASEEKANDSTEQQNNNENTDQNSGQDLAKAAADEKTTINDNNTDENDTDTSSDSTTATKEITKTLSIKVKKHDTIFSVAKRYHTTAAQIRKTNHLHGNKISAGQTLKIHSKQTVTVTENNTNKNISKVAKTKHHHTKKSSKNSKTVKHVREQTTIKSKKTKKDDWETIPESKTKTKNIKNKSHSHAATKNKKKSI